jgi:hypothetical protein
VRSHEQVSAAQANGDDACKLVASGSLAQVPFDH